MITKVWRISPGGRRRLMHTITETSKFHSFKMPEEMFKAENQMKVAQWCVDGWKTNGSFPPGTTWEIEQEF